MSGRCSRVGPSAIAAIKAAREDEKATPNQGSSRTALPENGALSPDAWLP